MMDMGEDKWVKKPVYVGAHDTLEVAPADDDADSDTSLVGSFDIVGAPCNTVADETTINQYPKFPHPASSARLTGKCPKHPRRYPRT